MFKKCLIFFSIFLLIILSSCSIAKTSKEQNSNCSSETTTSFTNFEATTKKAKEYEQQLKFLEECIAVDYFIDNDTMVGIYYNQNSDRIFLAVITKTSILISNNELPATSNLVHLNDSFALIDYGQQKNIKIFNYSLKLLNEFHLKNYYRNSIIKNYYPGEISISQDAHKLCFTVSTNKKDIIYLLDNNTAYKIYEIDKTKSTENDISGISRLLCINNENLYFEGSTTKNGTTTNDAILGYISLNNFKLYKILKKNNSSFYSNGIFIYSQDYQISNKDIGSGKISIINSYNNNIIDITTTNKQESLNCIVSFNGTYCCTIEENENNTLINIYNTQSNTLIKKITTNLNITKCTIFIDEKNKFLYISDSTDLLKYMEKYKF